jgi:N-acetylneuraminic acid mutarotase
MMHSKTTLLSLLCLVATATAQASGSGSGKRCFKTLASIPKNRQEHSVVASGKTVYIYGGVTGPKGDQITPALEAYNIANNTWTSTLAPGPLGMHHPNLASVDGKIYVLGGMKAPWNPTGESFKYDIATNKWANVAPVPIGVGSAAVGVLDKKIWLVGGWKSGKGGTGLTTTGEVFEYDVDVDKWTAHPSIPLPQPRDHAGPAVINSTLYIVGGRVGSPTANRDTVFSLNLASPDRKWTELAKLPFVRGGISAAAVGNKIYAFGGEGNFQSPKGVFGDAFVYDVGTNKAEVLGKMTVPRHGFGAVTVGQEIYLPGGGLRMGGGEATDTMEAYVPC